MGGTNERGSWLSPELLGVSMMLAWVYLLFYGVGDQGAVADLPSNVVFWASGAALVAVLLPCAALPQRALAVLGVRWARVAAPALMAAGTLLTVLPTGGGVAPFLVGSAFTGVGSAALACRWAHAFACRRTGVVLLHGVAVIAATVVVSELVSYLPHAGVVVLTSALPLVSAPCLERAENADLPDHHAAAPGSDAPREREARRAVLASLFACLFVLGFVPAFLPMRTDAQFDVFTVVFCMLSTAVVLLSVCLYVVSYHRRDAAGSILVPLAFILVAFVPSGSLGPDGLLGAFLPTGYICLEALLFLIAVLAAKRTRSSAVRLYAAGRVTFVLSDILGYLLGSAVRLTGDALLALEASLTAAGSCVVLLTMTLLLRVSSEGYYVRRALGAETPSGPEPEASAEERAFAAFSDAHGLTAREREVALQLLRGRDAHRIQEELCISRGTVSYHTQNVYAKCDVHSKQELMDAFERQAAKG